MLFGLIQTKADRVSALDLSKETAKAMKKHGWTEERARSAELDYRRFLFLLAKHPGYTIVPWTNDLDMIWHEHLLDTRKYESDCLHVLGRFLHHDPHLSATPKKAWQAKRDTQRLYARQFTNIGDSPKHAWLGATAVGLTALSLTPHGQRLSEEEDEKRRRDSGDGGDGGGTFWMIQDAPYRNPDAPAGSDGDGDGGDGGGGCGSD